MSAEWNVVIVGARERPDSMEDKAIVERIIREAGTEHGGRLHVISVGCDKGVGKWARDFCMQHKVKFAEIRIKFEGEFSKNFFAHMFLARNTCLTQVGDEFYVFKGVMQNGIIDDLIGPAKKRVTEKRVKIFNACQSLGKKL